MARAYIALGSNLGDRAANLALARQGLAQLADTKVLRTSTVEETAPLGGREQPAYLNQMVLIETALSPRELLAACQAIERRAGRIRAAADRWASRTLDLDIVRFGSRQVREPGLTIPHPALPEREFWQREIAEIDAHDERD